MSDYRCAAQIMTGNLRNTRCSREAAYVVGISWWGDVSPKGNPSIWRRMHWAQFHIACWQHRERFVLHPSLGWDGDEWSAINEAGAACANGTRLGYIAMPDAA